MKVDTPGIGLSIIFVIAFSLGIQLAFELACIHFIYKQEDYQDVLERERNMKEKIRSEKHKLLYG